MRTVYTLVLLIVLALSFGGCGRRVKQRSAEKTNASVKADAVGSNETQTQAVSSSVLPGFTSDRFNRPFQYDLDREDPSLDGWDSEAFHESSKKQLQVIGDFIIGAGKREDLAKVVTADFQCVALRPLKLETVFEDAVVVVRRPADNTDHTKRLNGVSGLLQTIGSLNNIVDNVAPHVHFKIIHVDRRDGAVTTTCYFQIGGSTKQASAQIRSKWHCRWKPNPDGKPKLASIEIEDYEEVVSASKRSKNLFSDCTDAVVGATHTFQKQFSLGLDSWAETIDRHMGMDIVGNHGLAVGDVNNDGRDDIYICEPGGLPNRLFFHKSDGTIRDVSRVAGVDFLESTRAALIINLDNDADQDMVIATDRFVLFLENDGNGRFGTRAAIKTDSVLTSIAAADFDLDGDLDVYACGYFQKEETAEGTVGLGNPIPFHDANNGAENALIRNDGRWQFRDVTKEVGLDQDNLRFSLAAAWEDYDNDGDPDLYVANDYGRNCLYRNDRGRFINVAAEAGVEDISAGMSVSWGDYNQDGLWDIYVSNMFSSAGNRISYQRQFKTEAKRSTVESYQRFARGNSLFENNGDGTFSDVTEAAHITLGRWAWCSNFIDLNNDGLEDFFVANGMLTREDTGDL